MIQKFNVSRDDSIYEAWPDVVLTDGGKLICVFSECEHHKNREAAIKAVKKAVVRALKDLVEIPVDDLVEGRYNKIRSYGNFY